VCTGSSDYVEHVDGERGLLDGKRRAGLRFAVEPMF
jgi:hypothetical protein